MQFLRQSTAVTIMVGPFADKTTALALTALTDQSANGRIVKGSTGAAITASSWAHDAAGIYAVGLTTSHTDTVGRLRISFYDAATYLPTTVEFSVLSAAVYDWLFGATAPSTFMATSDTVTLKSGTHTGAVVPTVTAVTNAVTAGTVSDKTGYSLTQTFPPNFSAMSITAGGAVTAGTVSDKTGYALSVTPPTASTIATAVRDVDNTTPAAGSLGAKVNSAASAGDPWTTSLPGAYGAGTAGYILGHNVDATVSSRGTSTFNTSTDTVTLKSGTHAGATIPTVNNVANAVTVGTVNDKTGYSLSQAFPTNFSALAIDGTGKITVGTMSDKTGYSLTQAFPSNFASMSITSGGAVSVGSVDSIAVESGINLRQAVSLILASAAGPVSGAGQATVILWSPNNTARVTATCDASGNRTAIILNPPA